MLDAYEVCHKLCEEIIPLINDGIREVYTDINDPQKPMPQKMIECANALYALKNTEKLVNEVRLHADRIINFLEQAVSNQHALDLTAEGSTQIRSIHTEWCVATPRFETQIPLPKQYTNPKDEKQSESNQRFAQIAEWLGIPKDVVAREIVEFRWNGLKEYFEERIMKGEPLPKNYNIHQMYYKTSVSCRKKRDLLDREKKDGYN